MRRLRVLVVDDESLIRWSIAETLSRAGHTVIEADNGAAAIRALSEPVDAVVLDYRLPDSNGLTLLATVRQIAPASRVILMTAQRDANLDPGARALGAFRILDKPFEMQGLEALLVEACASRPPS